VQIELAGLDPEDIARRPRDEDVVPSERLAKLRDADAERRRAGRGRLLAPELVDQPVARDDLVRVEQEHREQRPLPRSRERKRATALEHLERTQDPKLHVREHANTAVTAALQPGVTLFRNEADERPQVKRGRKMMVSTRRLRRLVTLAAALGAVMVAAPLAQAETDGALLTKASQAWQLEQIPTIGPGGITDGALLTEAALNAALQVNPGRGTDGALLSEAAETAALKELARVNPGRVSDGMLLTEASLLYELAQINPGYGTGESLVSETPVSQPVQTVRVVQPDGFDWGDAAAGFGIAAGAALLAGAALTLRRRSTLAHMH
jgi:hypothetical protein